MLETLPVRGLNQFCNDTEDHMKNELKMLRYLWQKRGFAISVFRDFVLVSKMGYTASTSSAAVQRYSIVLIETSALTVCALSGNMAALGGRFSISRDLVIFLPPFFIRFLDVSGQNNASETMFQKS